MHSFRPLHLIHRTHQFSPTPSCTQNLIISETRFYTLHHLTQDFSHPSQVKVEPHCPSCKYPHVKLNQQPITNLLSLNIHASAHTQPIFHNHTLMSLAFAFHQSKMHPKSFQENKYI
ncbi:hypothetical protein V8G54_024436 [Vigna mungo]|uniref:Uncharacterized protein n=1 Tax=Vigna mungo TaxID=3915 RepID=A0AAQ3N4U3_VIGMU